MPRLIADADDLEDAAEAEEISEEISSPRRWAAAVILLLGGLSLQRLAADAPGIVDFFYSRNLYSRAGRFVSSFSGVAFFSIAEVLAVLLVIGLLIWFVLLLRKVYDGFLNPAEFIIYLCYCALWGAGWTLMLFLLMWGLNYHRTPIEKSWALAERETRPGELENICNTIVSGVNRNYEQARAGLGVASDSRLPITRDRLYVELEDSFAKTALLQEAAAGGFSPPKPLKFSALLTSFGISGIYSPFTGEANYNADSPACDLPFVIAHEKAHQRGFARENEANFLAFVTCIRAGDPFIRYSGYLHSLRVMKVLGKTNEPVYQALSARLGTGPRADLQARAAFWRGRENIFLGDLARRSNNTYLRANNVRSGIANYDEYTALIINYLLQYPDGITPAPAPAPATAAPAAARPAAPPPQRPAARSTELEGVKW